MANASEIATTARFIVGDSLSVLRALPDASVDLVLTSPPFLALRSYLPGDHPDKGKEMGSEATPGEFIDALLGIVEECARVLTPHGSLVIELGDTYAGTGGSGGDYTDVGSRAGQDKFDGSAIQYRRTAQRNRSQVNWPMDKSLCLIPELFRIALVYGFNPLTGRETARWRARNVLRWVRPNPPVGALGDKFRPATSEMIVACKSRKRYFDLDAVRGEPSPNTHARTAAGVESQPRIGKSAERDGNFATMPELYETAGAPPLDWWSIPPGGYSGSHYAVFPAALLDKPILAMCPQRVCVTCGVPSERIAETTNAVGSGVGRKQWRGGQVEHLRKGAAGLPDASTIAPDRAERLTTGWTDCGHDNWRAGVVLDPFVGSGTTLEVAIRHGRDAIGIDIDERNADLARERVGMFLSIDAVVPA